MAHKRLVAGVAGARRSHRFAREFRLLSRVPQDCPNRAMKRHKCRAPLTRLEALQKALDLIE